MTKYKTNVIINLELEGLHCFPAARELFPEVSFLSDPHRHLFKVQLKKRVTHTDRDIEFIIFKFWSHMVSIKLLKLPLLNLTHLLTEGA
jgi:hypothetical protein